MQSTTATALGFALVLVACGGHVGTSDAGSPADTGAEDAPACPATQPPTGSACPSNGQMCTYTTRCIGPAPVPCTCLNGEWSCQIPRCDVDAG